MGRATPAPALDFHVHSGTQRARPRRGEAILDRILLIEDEPGAQLLFKNRLEDLGHEVVVAATGARGILEARAGGFDMFLVDIGLGSGIDGYEVCRRLKGTPEIRSIPVVLISGQVKNSEELHKGYQAGCEAYLVKGDVTLLEDVVRAMLRLKSLQDELALQNRLLGEQNKRLQTERQRGADLELALRETGSRALVFRELAAGRPDGILLVDGEGVVRHADRGARDILGKDVEGNHLGRIAPHSGLEAFVRDARTESHEAFRFDLGGGGRAQRSLSASVVPMVPGSGEGGLRVVLLLDASKRRVAAEMLRLEEHGIPRRELGQLMEAARRTYHPSSLLGASESIANLRASLPRLSAGEEPVLLRGEQGSGKGHVARTIHYGGLVSGPFVPVNCGAITPSLLESELFGHVKGAFPEAIADRPGLFHQAQHGTLYLNSVHELPPALQPRILQVMEDGEVFRVGSRAPESVQVRVIAATDQPLEKMVEKGLFHEALFQRLASTELFVPALRERIEDLEALTRHYLARHSTMRDEPGLAEEAVWVLKKHDWPGNVRELENCLERACALARGARIEMAHLPPLLQELHERLLDRKTIPSIPPTGEKKASAGRHSADEYPDIDVMQEPVSLQNYEKKALLRALRECDGDRIAAAKRLGIGKSTLYRKLKVHGI